MWNLIVFLASYLLKGKPKKKQTFLSVPFYDVESEDLTPELIQSNKESLEFLTGKFKEVVSLPKWEVLSTQKLDIPNQVSYIIFLQEKYY